MTTALDAQFALEEKALKILHWPEDVVARKTTKEIVDALKIHVVKEALSKPYIPDDIVEIHGFAAHQPPIRSAATPALSTRQQIPPIIQQPLTTETSSSAPVPVTEAKPAAVIVPPPSIEEKKNDIETTIIVVPSSQPVRRRSLNGAVMDTLDERMCPEWFENEVRQLNDAYRVRTKCDAALSRALDEGSSNPRTQKTVERINDTFAQTNATILRCLQKLRHARAALVQQLEIREIFGDMQDKEKLLQCLEKTKGLVLGCD